MLPLITAAIPPFIAFCAYFACINTYWAVKERFEIRRKKTAKEQLDELEMAKQPSVVSNRALTLPNTGVVHWGSQTTDWATIATTQERLKEKDAEVQFLRNEIYFMRGQLSRQPVPPTTAPVPEQADAQDTHVGRAVTPADFYADTQMGRSI